MEDFSNEALVAEVEKRTAIYDKDNPNYTNRAYIHREWKQIGNKLGVNPAIAKKKWIGLRDYMNRAWKVLPDGSKGQLSRKRWYLYDSMSFLIPHLTSRAKTISGDPRLEDENYSLVSGSESEFPHSGDTSLALVCETDTSLCDVDEQRANGSPSTEPVYSRKRRAEHSQDQVLDNSSDFGYDDNDLNLQTVKSRRPAEENRDDVDLFLLSLAPCMRTLNRFSRIECQAEMQLLLLRFMRGHGNSNNNDSCVHHHTRPQSPPKNENQ